MAQEKTIDPATAKRRGRLKLFTILAVCAAPLVASYLAYYVATPSDRTNYGAILDPRTLPIPEMATTTLDGKPRTLADLKGKWIMVRAGGAECGEECQRQLWAMRQWQVMQGKNQTRLERVWLITDDKPLETVIIREYDGTEMLRAPGEVVAKWLPAEPGTTIADHIYLIDPLGNLMMRWPKAPEPARVHKDISKLLKASGIG